MKTLKIADKNLRQSALEKIDCSQPVKVPEMSCGTMWAQGDIGILKIKGIPKKAIKISMPENGQLAPGNTQGSRHCIAKSSQKHVQIFSIDDRDNLSDLILEAKSTWTLEHPQHAHCTFKEGIYRILHQQNEQRMRVLD